MKELPILFNAAMVQTILDGRKTQTRRVIRGLPVDGVYFYMIHPQGDIAWFNDVGTGLRSNWPKCPYGKIGDYLWVRETWGAWPHMNGDYQRNSLRFRATDSEPDNPNWRWRPSIHMPRWASRITLEVTGVRVERVQEISEEDAFAEGIGGGDRPGDPCGTFAKLWDSINANRGYSWQDNPWVWAVEFRVIEQ